MGSRQVGGPDRSLANLAHAFAALGSHLHVAIIDDGRTQWGPINELFASQPATLHRLATAHRFDLRGPLRLARLARAVGARVIHTLDYKADVLACLAAPMARGRWVATLHGTPGSTRRLRLYRVVDRFILRRAAAVFAVSDELASQAGGRLRPRRIPNVVAAPARPPRDRVTLPRRLVSVARLEPEKHLDLLLDALAISLREVPDLSLTIVGEGSCRRELEARAARLGIGSEVRFVGWVRDTTSFLDEAELFVLPSREEQQPMALLEAMARGLPAVVTAVGQAPALIDEPATGLVVPPGDCRALASALVAAARASFDSAAAWARVVRDHSPRALATVYLETYAGLSGGGGAPEGHDSREGT